MRERQTYSLGQRLLSGLIAGGLIAGAGWLLSGWVGGVAIALYVIGILLALAVIFPALGRAGGRLGYPLGLVIGAVARPFVRR